MLWECSSSMMTIKFIFFLCASAIRSKRFLRSLSLMAVLPRLVTSSQFMKVVLSGSNPFCKASNKFCVFLCGATEIIFLRLCSSRSPLPGHNQITAVLEFTLLKYSSTYPIRIIVLPAPVGAFITTVCLLLLSVERSSRFSTAFS